MTSIQSIKTGNPVPTPNPSKQVQPIEDFLKSFDFQLHAQEKPALTADTAKSLIYRAMTTGVPNSEMDKFGGSMEVMKVFEANGGQYDIMTIPDDLRRELAQKVSESGVGNLLAAKIDNLTIASSAIQTLSDAGVDSAVIEQLRRSGHQLAEGLEATSVQTQPSAVATLPGIEFANSSSHAIVNPEPHTTSEQLQQAIEDATANALPYVDSASYLNGLFKA
ncbi:hypothetical protein [Limnohabitans sp. Rim28]|uniref:hypothetical protein n=1 Tax=Limnohabitans sp. Rim28 TaxID=1100720 RepID=UPI0002F3EF08|nr:hypothetical protein [Limnohabitans sp. Rim28]PVE05190.1 hypothetical protein B472_16005 [Limnohabitans sp. Rim28]